MNTLKLRSSAAIPDAEIAAAAGTGVREIVVPASPGRPLGSVGGFVLERHPECEVMLSLVGSCEYALGDKVFTVRPGCAVLVPEWCHHARGCRSCDDALAQLWILAGFRSCRCFTFSRGHLGIARSFSLPLPVHLGVLAKSRMEEWCQAGSRPESARRYFLSVFNAVLDEVLISREGGGALQGADIVAETLMTIRSLYGCSCSLEQLARRAGCSKFHLAHLIRERTGRTVKSFVDEARIAYIKAARMHGIMQKEIAANLGFSSPSACGNWMRKHLPPAPPVSGNV